MKAKSWTPSTTLVALDRAACVDQGVGLAGLGAGRLDAVGIALGIAELERILADLRRRQHAVTGVEQHVEAHGRPDPPVMVAARADVEILLEFPGEEHRLAFRAFVPQIVGRFPLGQEGDAVADLVQPAHLMLLGPGR
jgi:hypothetical protein